MLDGTTPEQGDAMAAALRNVYAPLGIRVTSSFRSVDFTGASFAELMDEAKALVGGKRPDSVDAVYVFTTKDLGGGQADCIGGIRYPDRAFAAGSVSIPSNTIAGVTIGPSGDGELAAHELGHLLGGEHEMATCPDGTHPDEPA